MRLARWHIIKVFFIVIVASALFIGTSFIDRHGPAVSNWKFSDEAPYRHARGIPLMYLQRSLPDGVCEVKDPLCKLQNHQINILFFVADAAFWIIVAGLGVEGLSRIGEHGDTA